VSFQAMAWAVKQKTGDAMGRCLLLTLANYADEHGKCWPSLSRLAEDCEMHRATVIRKLEVLRELGLIDREPKETPAGTYNVYTLSLTATPSRTERLPQSHTATTLVAQCDPILSREPIRDTKPSPAAELELVVSPETASAIVEHRQRMRAALTARAAKALAKQLAKWPDPEEAAAAMLARGWRGFEPDWMPKQPERKASVFPMPAWKPGRLA